MRRTLGDGRFVSGQFSYGYAFVNHRSLLLADSPLPRPEGVHQRHKSPVPKRHNSTPPNAHHKSPVPNAVPNAPANAPSRPGEPALSNTAAAVPRRRWNATNRPSPSSVGDSAGGTTNRLSPTPYKSPAPKFPVPKFLSRVTRMVRSGDQYSVVRETRVHYGYHGTARLPRRGKMRICRAIA
mgnify:FL=1